MFASSGGFGIDFDILGSNLLNILVVLGLLIYLGKGVIGNILGERKSVILSAIKDAEEQQKDALLKLTAQKEKLARAQQEAESILEQAETTAKQMEAEILSQAENDVVKMKAAAEREIAAEQDRALTQLRRLAVRKALEKVEEELPKRLDDDLQSRLIDNSIQLLGG
ncbi:MAG: F0F1 ATP synthase subunit B [Synechococcus sp.]